MKQLIFFICALFACINTAKAQYTISISDLDGTKWQTARQYDKQLEDYYEYTKGAKIRHKKDGSTFAYPYYLSNSIPEKFDYTKVGKNTQGSYLIQTNPKSGMVRCYIIRKFSKTDGTMILENVEGEPITYILIPSNKPRNQSANEDILDPSIW